MRDSLCSFVTCQIFSHHLCADELQDDANLKLGSLSHVPISMILSDCQHDVVFMSCLSKSLLSRIDRCGSQSFLGVLSHNNLSLVSARGFYPSFSSTCKLTWRMYDQEFSVRTITIFERVLYRSSVSSLLYPNSQEITVAGNDFSASQVTRCYFKCISF